MGKNMKYINGDSGGAGGDGTKYNISVVAGGPGVCKANYKKAVKDVTVTLSVTLLDSQYEFDYWQVVSGGVTISDNKFTMGTEDVSIVGHFKQIQSGGIDMGA